MSKVFLTGDRSMPEVLAVLPTVAQITQLRKEFGPDVELVTGTNSGFENVVRLVCEAMDVPVLTLEQSTGEDGKPDWDARHGQLTDFDRVVFVHGDPLSSSIGKSLTQFVDDEKLVLL